MEDFLLGLQDVLTRKRLYATMLAVVALAGTLGEKPSAIAVSSFGAADFHFTINPLSTYVLSPAILLLCALLATVWGTSRAGEVKLYESIVIRERNYKIVWSR